MAQEPLQASNRRDRICRDWRKIDNPVRYFRSHVQTVPMHKGRIVTEVIRRWCTCFSFGSGQTFEAGPPHRAGRAVRQLHAEQPQQRCDPDRTGRGDRSVGRFASQHNGRLLRLRSKRPADTASPMCLCPLCCRRPRKRTGSFPPNQVGDQPSMLGRLRNGRYLRTLRRSGQATFGPRSLYSFYVRSSAIE